jgi:hypothetical protein
MLNLNKNWQSFYIMGGVSLDTQYFVRSSPSGNEDEPFRVVGAILQILLQPSLE